MSNPDDAAETARLSELSEEARRYAALLRAGKRIAVTDEDGEVVGYLTPQAHLALAGMPGSTLERMIAAGQVRMPTGNILDHLTPLPARPGEPLLSEVLQQMRDEERY